MGAKVQVTDSESRVKAWESRAEVPLLVCAAAFLVAYAWPILDTGLAAGARTICDVVVWVAWAVFALDYLARLALSGSKLRFLKRNLLDLAVIALPLLRPLRLLRLLTLARVLNRSAIASVRGRMGVYVVGATVFLGFVAALAVLDAERDQPGSNIASFGDALWWTATTMTTVGYGDRYPTTDTGRVIAVALMISGIAVLGMVTATLASWISDLVRAEEAATDELTEEIRELRRLLAERGAVDAAGGEVVESHKGPAY